MGSKPSASSPSTTSVSQYGSSFWARKRRSSGTLSGRVLANLCTGHDDQTGLNLGAVIWPLFRDLSSQVSSNLYTSKLRAPSRLGSQTLIVKSLTPTLDSREGIHWLFLGPEDELEPIYLDNFNVSAPAALAITNEVAKLAKDGRILEVTDSASDPEIVFMCLPLFAIPQKDSWRVVWDARELNRHVACESFVMETITSAAKMLKPGDFMISADMWAGYHQLE